MRFKDDTINPAAIRAELLFALIVANKVYEDAGRELVITSLNDGRHSTTSLHYAGCAADLRTRNFENRNQAQAAARRIKDCLNVDYDVILESDHGEASFIEGIGEADLARDILDHLLQLPFHQEGGDHLPGQAVPGGLLHDQRPPRFLCNALQDL